VVVAVFTVLIVEVRSDKVIRMIAVRHLLVTAVRPVAMVRSMAFTRMRAAA
jgi:hypothetical protein